jgi:HAD superfamily hydrolase (TIGR01509 family)
MTPDIGGVIFDCDGTLVDSEPITLASMVEQAREIDPLARFDDLLPVMKGRSIMANMASISERLGRALPPDFEDLARARMARAFREHLLPLPGALDLLRSLHLPYCVASNGPRHKMEVTLAVTGLLPWLEGRIFSAYEVGSYKPEPGLFLHAAQAMGVAPARCAVVEDSHVGIEAGLAAGMTVYALPASFPMPNDWAARVRPIDGLQALTRVFAPR